ncbi:MAG: hypothetical protein ACK515_05740 [bacterium]|jgi:hypothetical protein
MTSIAPLAMAAMLAWVLPVEAAQTLVTPNFEVRIEVLCAEGNVTCDKVRYTGTNRRNGRSITLTGRTLHSLCADGVSPCRFLGYEFRSGSITYTAFESGLLSVREGSKVLLEEQGAWR